MRKNYFYLTNCSENQIVFKDGFWFFVLIKNYLKFLEQQRELFRTTWQKSFEKVLRSIRLIFELSL